MKKISSKKQAFSLIEISIVILIIGILVAGVTQSSKLIKYSRLNSARSLTQSSPVAGISDLMLWYETSLETSFLDAEQTDGSTISTWYDNSPQSTVKNDASLNIGDGGNSCTSKPKFYEAVFNGGIPAARFVGTGTAGDCLRFNGKDLVGSNYTLFVVEQRRSATTSPYWHTFIGGSGASAVNLIFAYSGSMTVALSHFSNDLYAGNIVPAYTQPTPRIHTARFLATSATTSTASYWLNGGTTADATNSDVLEVLTSYAGAAIGSRGATGHYFNGDLAEIIIYTRALKTEERQAVEEYLSKKYAITIS
jgi:prepilin-type N-terminal cleavage/methylation domain-containing protein